MNFIKKIYRFLFLSELNFAASILFGINVAQYSFKRGLKEKFVLKNNVKPILYLLLAVICIFIMFNPPLFDNLYYTFLIHSSMQIFGAIYLICPMWSYSREQNHSFFLSVFSILGLFPFLYYPTLLIAMNFDSSFGESTVQNWMSEGFILLFFFFTTARILVTTITNSCFKSYYILLNSRNIITIDMICELQKKGFNLQYFGISLAENNGVDTLVNIDIDKMDVSDFKLVYQNKWKALNYLVLTASQILMIYLMISSSN